MLEIVLVEVDPPWDNDFGAIRGKARKISSLLDTDVCWPWALIHRNLLQPVWKQQILNRLLRRREKRRIEALHQFGYRLQRPYIDWLKNSLI
jgi:hypothetical protein